MFQLSKALINRPVMSLRTGRPVATTTQAIINPDNLKIEGLYCQDSVNKKRLVLIYQDIRDSIPQGLVIDDHDVLCEPEELVRLKNVLDIGFELIGMPVYTTTKKRLGKVSDYAVESSTFYIQKFYVSQSLLKSFNGSLSVDRSQIVEITNKRIVIQDPLQPKPSLSRAAIPAS
jgi:sporulation protein YlmC with PRC-barrel domain